MGSGWRRRWLGGQSHGFLYAKESNDDNGYIDARKELHQLAEDNREIETRQIDIKIEVVRFFGLHLRTFSRVNSTRRYVCIPRGSRTSSGKRVYRATLTWAYHLARASSQAQRGIKTLVARPSTSSEYLTFSNLPISSRSPDLLGVVVSTLPSASLPGHNNNRCFPLRSVLSFPSTSYQQCIYSISQEHTIFC